MGEPKITGFMISIVLVGFFVGIFGMMYADINDNYEVDDYRNESLAVYQDLDTIHSQAKEYQEDIEAAGANKNIVEQGWDIAGGILSAGITSLKISAQSINVFLGIGRQGAKELSENTAIGATTSLLWATLITIVILLIFLGIILPVILRWGKKL